MLIRGETEGRKTQAGEYGRSALSAQFFCKSKPSPKKVYLLFFLRDRPKERKQRDAVSALNRVLLSKTTVTQLQNSWVNMNVGILDDTVDLFIFLAAVMVQIVRKSPSLQDKDVKLS